MAKTLNDFNFGCNKGAKGYPWNQWLDGRIWQLTSGEDFRTSARKFQAMLAQRARRNGVRILSSVVGDKTVVIQAVERKGGEDE